MKDKGIMKDILVYNDIFVYLWFGFNRLIILNRIIIVSLNLNDLSFVYCFLKWLRYFYC